MKYQKFLLSLILSLISSCNCFPGPPCPLHEMMDQPPDVSQSNAQNPYAQQTNTLQVSFPSSNGNLQYTPPQYVQQQGPYYPPYGPPYQGYPPQYYPPPYPYPPVGAYPPPPQYFPYQSPPFMPNPPPMIPPLNTPNPGNKTPDGRSPVVSEPAVPPRPMLPPLPVPALPVPPLLAGSPENQQSGATVPPESASPNASNEPRLPGLLGEAPPFLPMADTNRTSPLLIH